MNVATSLGVPNPSKARRGEGAPVWTQPAEPSRENPRRLVAELIYDTGTQSLPRGLRAVGRRNRSLLLIAEDFEVMLEILPDSSSEHRSLTGNAMKEGLPLAGVAVRLDGPIHQAPLETDSDGAFRWSGLPCGEYVVMFEAGQQVIALPSLSLCTV